MHRTLLALAVSRTVVIPTSIAPSTPGAIHWQWLVPDGARLERDEIGDFHARWTPGRSDAALLYSLEAADTAGNRARLPRTAPRAGHSALTGDPR